MFTVMNTKKLKIYFWIYWFSFRTFVTTQHLGWTCWFSFFCFVLFRFSFRFFWKRFNIFLLFCLCCVYVYFGGRKKTKEKSWFANYLIAGYALNSSILVSQNEFIVYLQKRKKHSLKHTLYSLSLLFLDIFSFESFTLSDFSLLSSFFSFKLRVAFQLNSTISLFLCTVVFPFFLFHSDSLAPSLCNSTLSPNIGMLLLVLKCTHRNESL